MADLDSPSEDVPTPEALRVTDPAVAALLMDPRRLRHLAPFLGRTRSVSEVARETAERPNTVLKRVERLRRLGLLEVAERRPRRGRAIQRYRSVAPAFFVPFEATEADSLEQALAEREAYWEALLRRNLVRTRTEALGTWGTRIYRDTRGRLQVQMALTPDANVTTLDPEGPAVLSAWRDGLRLDFADAKALQRELFALLLRYQRKDGAQRYVVHLGMAPVRTP